MTTKAGEPLEKNSINLADESNLSVQCTFWREAAHDKNLFVGSIIAIKGAKVSNYGGVSINVSYEHAHI